MMARDVLSCGLPACLQLFHLSCIHFADRCCGIDFCTYLGCMSVVSESLAGLRANLHSFLLGLSCSPVESQSLYSHNFPYHHMQDALVYHMLWMIIIFLFTPTECLSCPPQSYYFRTRSQRSHPIAIFNHHNFTFIQPYPTPQPYLITTISPLFNLMPPEALFNHCNFVLIQPYATPWPYLITTISPLFNLMPPCSHI